VAAMLEDFSSVLSSLAQNFCCHDSVTISREILKIDCVPVCLSARYCASWLYVLLGIYNNLAFVNIVTALGFEISFSTAGINARFRK